MADLCTVEINLMILLVIIEVKRQTVWVSMVSMNGEDTAFLLF